MVVCVAVDELGYLFDVVFVEFVSFVAENLILGVEVADDSVV